MLMNREYKLGRDLIEKDSLLDGFTFEDVIEAVRCNEPNVNESTVRKTVLEMLLHNLQNFNELFESNMQEIIRRAMP